MAAQLMAFASSQRIGVYRLNQLLRKGQSTEVWSATDQRRMRTVALKLLVAGDRQAVRLLRHESLVGRKLEHPHVLAPREFGRAAGASYLVMELFRGCNLRDVAHQPPEKWHALLPQLIRQSAEALAYLHAQGWVHCDVKPDNFLANELGETRLIDFAIAVRRTTFWPQRLAGGGPIQGTRSYLSPEQIQRRRLDPRSDIYSFGCTLFHLLGGRPPYTGGSSVELLGKHLHAPVPRLDSANPQITPTLAQLVAEMMAKSPHARPATMERVVQRLAHEPLFRSASGTNAD